MQRHSPSFCQPGLIKAINTKPKPICNNERQIFKKNIKFVKTKQPTMGSFFFLIKSLQKCKIYNIWFAVTPCVYLLARQSLFFRELIALFYYRGVDLSDCLGDFSVLSVLKRTVLLFNYYLGGRYRKLAGTTTLAYRIVINCTSAE